MKRYTHIVSGARVSVRDGKVMDSSWKPLADAASGSAPEDDEPGAVPSGSVAELTEWVGEDRDRATRALQAEQGKGEKARVSLVSYLTKLTGAPAAEKPGDDK